MRKARDSRLLLCLLGLLVPLGGLLLAGDTDRVALVWPTPNRAFLEGRPLDAFVQPTASGRIESALYGCTRNGGSRFHEGIDLAPVERNSRGEAVDPVYAVSPGSVAYTNRVAGHSSYGRYVVLRHRVGELEYYTLYAHLASVDDRIITGRPVEAGSVLGVMGRSAAGTSIPRHRAHLHFEIGFQLSEDFPAWFASNNPGATNHHGAWSGLNLVGVDPLDYFQSVLSGRATGMVSYLRLQPLALELRYYTRETPDFLRRSPGLIVGQIPAEGVAAWDISFNRYGVPIRWIPRGGELAPRPAGTVGVIRVDPEEIGQGRCRELIERTADGWKLGSTVIDTLGILFAGESG